MGPVHYLLRRFPKSICRIYGQSIGLSSSFHSSSSNQILYKDPIFMRDQHAFYQISPKMGLHSSFIRLEEVQFSAEAAGSGASQIPEEAERIPEEAERICSVLSSGPNSGIASVLDGAGVRVTPELVEEVLKRLGNAGMLALGFFRWAEKKEGFKYNTQGFHHLIEALGKIKQFKLVWGLVDSMKQKGLLRKDTFGLITRRYARARKIREAISSFEKMEEFGLKPELADYNSLIDTITKAKHVERAQIIFDDMKRKRNFSPDIKTYSILLEGWGNNRNLGKVKEVFTEMVDEGFNPDVVTYGILINCFCKLGKCDEALNIFREMEASGCKASPHIYCTLINGFGSAKRLDEALKYFKLSKASGYAPELPTYNAVVGAYCWVLQFEDAFRVVEEMKRYGIGPNARTYDIILQHLVKAGKKEEAYRLFQRMGKEGGCEPQLNTYTMMVSMLCNGERVDLALKVWKEMSTKGVLPCMHMFSALINGLCFENRLDDACKYFQEMLDKGIRPPGQLFSNLKSALLDGGKNELAFQMGSKLDRLRKTPLYG
ncbi:putative LRR receptor-like serine/threonine-protein kinase [Iris pallida]|uniref:LRR receptor-like serine/threonine-protein kinase n=1 Tax=Iris pallida TaxID=29817 RepID=A0AAX6G1L3_IRIPA|nr:putative LRR receptor-like serine/threonine-protein kinase [Iris pallida]